MYDLQVIEGNDLACQEIEIEGFRILIPNAASHLLDGIQIDYVDKLMGGGFKINNPNANALLRLRGVLLVIASYI